MFWRNSVRMFFLGLCEVLCIKNYFIELSRFAREGITSGKLKVEEFGCWKFEVWG